VQKINSIYDSEVVNPYGVEPPKEIELPINALPKYSNLRSPKNTLSKRLKNRRVSHKARLVNYR
jgi:hypothetical protein